MESTFLISWYLVSGTSVQVGLVLKATSVASTHVPSPSRGPAEGPSVPTLLSDCLGLCAQTPAVWPGLQERGPGQTQPLTPERPAATSQGRGCAEERRGLSPGWSEAEARCPDFPAGSWKGARCTWVPPAASSEGSSRANCPVRNLGVSSRPWSGCGPSRPGPEKGPFCFPFQS